MAGLLDLANVSKNQAMQGFGQAAQLQQQRDTANENLKQQASAQRKEAIGQAIGTGIGAAAMAGGGMTMAGLAAGGPVGLAVGGLMLLGSLF